MVCEPFRFHQTEPRLIMPKFPHFADRVGVLQPPVFEQFMPAMRKAGESLVRLHIGESEAAPPYNTHLTPEFLAQNPNATKYANTFGIAPLRAALAQKMESENHLSTTSEHILVTSGATQGLSLASQALFQQGDEVLVFTPAWPLTFGIVALSGATLVEIPRFHELDLTLSEFASELRTYFGPNTAGIIVNSPNNPTGNVLSTEQLQVVAEVAAEQQAWIVSDEAYDGLAFDDVDVTSIGSLSGAYERTITLNTFSKLYQFAGARLGWVTAIPEVLAKLNQVLVHQNYNAPTVSQYQVLQAVESRNTWKPHVVEALQRKRDITAAVLGEEAQVKAGYFAFVRLPHHDQDTRQFVHQCIDNGVSIAPGIAFGRDFQDYIRICFTGVSESMLQKGLQLLKRELARK